MSGKFNPFQTKQAEVVRTHTVATRKKALKIFDKVQRKRPCVWAEVQSLNGPGAEQTLNALNGETSVVLFIDAILDCPIGTPLPPALDALVVRLWKKFNKLHVIQRVEAAEEGDDDPGD